LMIATVMQSDVLSYVYVSQMSFEDKFEKISLLCLL